MVITIFNGMELRTAVKEAQMNHRVTEENIQNINQNIEREIHQAVNNIVSAKTIILDAEPQVKLADTAYSMAQTRYEAGVVTSVDVLDAQNRKQRAELLKLQTEYKLKMAYFQLRNTIGDIADMIDFR
jgi:outer membrane protein TolC